MMIIMIIGVGRGSKRQIITHYLREYFSLIRRTNTKWNLNYLGISTTQIKLVGTQKFLKIRFTEKKVLNLSASVLKTKDLPA